MWFDIVRDHSPINWRQVFLHGIKAEFSSDYPWVDWPYRPLEHVLVPAQILLSKGNLVALKIIKGVGFAAVLFLNYLIMLRLSRNVVLAAVGSVLIGFSVPMLLETWWFHHMAVWVSVFILLGIYGYLQYEATGRTAWLGGVIASSVIAPWVAEAALFLPLSLLFHCVSEPGRRWKLVTVLFVLTLHATFPSFVPRLLLEGRISTSSIFGAFSAGAALREGLFSTLQTRTPYLLLGFLTPVLSLLAGASLSSYLVRTPNIQFKGMTIAALVLTLVGVFYMYPPPTDTVVQLMPVLSTLLPIVVALATIQKSKLLAIWFIVSYLPYLRVVGLSVTLIPAGIPWVMLLTIWLGEPTLRMLDRMRNDLRQSNTTVAWMSPTWFAPAIGRYPLGSLLVFLVCIGLLAQIANLLSAREVWAAQTSVTRQIGIYVKEHLTPNAVLFGERDGLLEPFGIRYFADRSIDATVVGHSQINYPAAAHVVQTRNDLKALLERHRNRDAYFLIQDAVPEVLYHYVWDNRPDFRLAQTFDYRPRVSIIDPLFFIMPADAHMYLGYEFLRLYPFKDSMLQRSFLASFSLYRYLPSKVPATQRESRPRFVSTYRRYSIFEYGQRFFATRNGIKFDYAALQIGQVGPAPMGLTLAGVKRAIRVLEQAKQGAGGLDYDPHLVTSLAGFNVIAYRGEYFGIPQGEGVFDYKRFIRRQYSVQARGATPNSIEKRLSNRNLRLVSENVRGFNIVVYRDEFYGIPQIDGTFDPAKIETGGYGKVFVGKTSEDVSRQIRDFMGPRVVETYRGFDIIGQRTKYFLPPQYYGIPQGWLELSTQDYKSVAIFTDASPETIRSAIDNRLAPQLKGFYRGYAIVQEKESLNGASWYCASKKVGPIGPCARQPTQSTQLRTRSFAELIRLIDRALNRTLAPTR